MSPRQDRFAAWKAKPGRPALVALLEATQGRVFAICRDVLQHREDAEEAVQEVLLKIVSGIEEIGDADHFERWVGTVAYRTAIDRKRSRKRRKERDLAAAQVPSRANPSEGLHDAIARLPEDDRALIVERYFERRTLDEMATRRRLSDVGVRKRIEKAHGRLKRMLGTVMGFGVMCMKAKAAAVAVVLIPLLGLSVGVVVASARRSAGPVTETRERKPNPKVQAWLAESKHRPAPAPKTPEAVVEQKAVPDRGRIRAEFVTTLERLRYVRRRSAECKELWPEASTEEEGRALQREKVILDEESGVLYRSLMELAAQDPANIVELVTTARDLPERLTLMGLIAPDVNSEITSEAAPSGPLLAGLLSLAHGETEEKTYFAAFAGQLRRANRELGQALMTLMADADFHVRKHAGESLMALADAGELKEFLKGQIPALKQAALRQGEPLDYLCVGSPLKILATIGAEEADDFVLHRFEAMESWNDHETIIAAYIAAPRLVARHEARLVMAILRGLELPASSGLYYSLLQVAEHLSPEQRANISRVAELNAPPPSPVNVPHLGAVRTRERPVYRSMTGVSRWTFDASPNITPVRR